MNNKRIKKTISTLILTVLFIYAFYACCGKMSERQQLDEKVFVQAYCDVVTYADLLDTKRRDAFVDSVLAHYQITREQFQSTTNAYSRDEKKWEKIMIKIVAELERREKEIATEVDTIKTTK